MIFEAASTKERVIERLSEERGVVEEFVLDFGDSKNVQKKATIKFPVPKIDEDGDEDFDYEEYKECKSSEESKKFYSMPSMFRDVTSFGVDSPLQHYYNEIIGDVNKFIQALGVKLHWQQQQLIDAYANGDTNIATRSGQGPGKTFCSTIIWLHWLMANPYGLLVITAPTMRQCKDVWLAQARQIVQESDPRIKAAFEFTNTGIKMFGHKASDWGCYLATANKPENFQGIHRERLGIHCEEASGLDRQIIETIQGTLSNAEGTYLWLQIGNPNTRDCAFYDCFYGPSSVWTTLHWNGEETPETKFFSQRRNIEVEEEHGRDSDVYRIRVLGEFPSLDPTSILNLEQLVACTTTEALMNATKINAQLKLANKMRYHLGMDVARFGGDESTVVPWTGNIQGKLVGFIRKDPNDVVDHAVMMQNELEWDNKQTLYIVDTSGMGEAVVGRLGQEKRMGKRVHEFYTQNCAADSTKYADKMSEAWFLFAKAVKKKEVYIKNDKKTFEQLSKRRFVVDKKGRLKVESKDEYKKRQSAGSDVGQAGASPDRADGLLMGYYPPAQDSVRIKAFE